MPKPEFILNIHIPLPTKLVRAIKKAQKDLGLKYVADPHITLYMCRFTPAAYRKLNDKMERLDLNKIKIRLSALAGTRSKKGGWFFYLPVSGKDLRMLHETILGLANPLRGKLQRSRETQRIKNGIYNLDEIQYLERYGYVEVLDKFKPHVTIFDADEFDKSVVQKLRAEIKSLLGELQISAVAVNLYEYTDEYIKVAEKSYKLK